MIAQFARCPECGHFLRSGRHARGCAEIRAARRAQAQEYADRAHAEPPHGRARRGRKRNTRVNRERLVAGMPTATREHGLTFVLPDDDASGVYALFTQSQRKRAVRTQSAKVLRSTARERRTRVRAARRASGASMMPVADVRSTQALIDAGIIPAVNRAQSQFD